MTPSERGRAQFNARSFDEARQRGLRKSLETRRNAPRCGARRRTDGEPCMQPVQEADKRCRYHGGATPKGREWHRRQWPKKGAAPSRLAGKMKALQLRDRQAEKRRAVMAPEEREKHEARRRVVKPGTPAERWQAAENRKAAKWLSERLDGPQRAAREAQAPSAAGKGTGKRPETPSALGNGERSSTGGAVASAGRRQASGKRTAQAQAAKPAPGASAPSAPGIGLEGAKTGPVPANDASVAEQGRSSDQSSRTIGAGLSGGHKSGEGAAATRPSIFD